MNDLKRNFFATPGLLSEDKLAVQQSKLQLPAKFQTVSDQLPSRARL